MPAFVFRLSLFVLCGLLLAYGLFRPAPPPDLFENSDKLWHLLAFGAFSLTARLTFLRMPAWLLWSVLFLSAPVSEWLQHQLQPVRQFSWHDIYANCTGVLLALLGWWLLCQVWSRYKRHVKPMTGNTRHYSA